MNIKKQQGSWHSEFVFPYKTIEDLADLGDELAGSDVMGTRHVVSISSMKHAELLNQ